MIVDHAHRQDRLMLGAVAAAVRLGAPEAKSVELAWDRKSVV